jgi:NADPH:quinone reductase-like Zn-dependent oxidoreductase
MIRAVIHAFGPPAETVQVETCEPPPLGAGMVHVRMTAAAINPSDIVTISGAYATRTRLPFVPGFEGVGVIEAAAPDAGLAPGDRVLPIGSAGAWQEVKTTEARWCFRVPDHLPDERAATSYINPLTAWVMLTERAALAPGTRMVVNAAGSAIGRILIRMANRQGVEPVALVRSAAARALLDGLGVAAVLESSSADGLAERLRDAAGDRGYDLALDAVGGEEGAALLAALRPGGRMIHYGLLSGRPLPAGRSDVALEYFWLRNWVHSAGRGRIERGLATVWDLVAAGVADSAIEARYPLTRVTQALLHDGRRGRRGKILIIP